MNRSKLFVLLVAVALVVSAAVPALASPQFSQPLDRYEKFYRSADFEQPDMNPLASEDSNGVGQGTAYKAGPWTVSGPQAGDGDNYLVSPDLLNTPHNETVAAVDPTNPNHAILGSHDYILSLVGGYLYETIPVAAYVTFDGGKTYTMVRKNPGAFGGDGDPAIAFSRDGSKVYYATIGFSLPQGSGLGQVPSVQVSRSDDGGLTWNKPVVVARGTGSYVDPGDFMDKEWIATGPGNDVYVTWTDFKSGVQGSYISSHIYFIASHDGGVTWGAPVQVTPNDLWGNQFSSPVVAQDGTIYVAFENSNTPDPTYRGQILVAKSTNGGRTFALSTAVKTIYDGVNDYPNNSDGRQTLTGANFRINSVGNLAIGPKGELYYAFADDRLGSASRTDNKVYVVSSTDGAQTWSDPVQVKVTAGDQVYPWIAVGPDGSASVSFMDLGYGTGHGDYGMSLAASADGGKTWSSSRIDTGLSDTLHSRYFNHVGLGASFIGDYTGLAVGSNGKRYAIWTDSRSVINFAGRNGYGQQAYAVVK